MERGVLYLGSNIRNRSEMPVTDTSELAINRIFEPLTVQAATTDQIRTWILDGTLQPGERLHQDRLAGLLGVSRMPVRESIRQLAAEGLVQIVTHRGAFVTALDPQAIREIYAIRAQLEALAVRNAVPNLQISDFEALRNLLNRMDELINSRAEETTIELDRRFHDTLMAAARMNYLLQLIVQTRRRSDVFRRAHTYIPGRAQISNIEHAAILAAVEARNVKSAERLVIDHLHNAAEHLISFISR